MSVIYVICKLDKEVCDFGLLSVSFPVSSILDVVDSK